MVNRQERERVGETRERKIKESGEDAEAHSRVVQFISIILGCQRKYTFLLPLM